MIQNLHGVIPPVVTPLNEDYSLDTVGLETLIEHLIAGGVHGLFILGTTGEGPHLSHALRKEVISETVRINNSRLPVLVGVTDTSIEELLDMSDYAKEAGVNAVVLAAPFYAPLHQSELEEWMKVVIPKIELPVILYDIPSHINVKLSVEVVTELSSIDNVIGIKDSSGDMAYFHMLLASIDRPGFRFFTGPEMLLAESVLMGGHGGVSGGANLYPKLFSRVYSGAVDRNFDILERGQLAQRALHTELYGLNGYGSGFMCGLHAAMAVKGICKNVLMPPYFAFQDEARIIEILASLEQRFPLLLT